jgi:hypothetical protein
VDGSRRNDLYIGCVSSRRSATASSAVGGVGVRREDEIDVEIGTGSQIAT